jgi:hypothetical protein
MRIQENLEQDLFNGKEKQKYLQQRISQLITPFVEQFCRISRYFVYFNLFFMSVLSLEILGFVLAFSPEGKSYFLAIGLAVFFLTGFSYFVLRLYMLAKKPGQLYQLKQQFVQACKEIIQFQEGSSEHLMLLAKSLSQLASFLKEKEFRMYEVPRNLEGIEISLQRFSAWWHWKDVFFVRELLLKEAVDYQIEIVKNAPVHLHTHAALANAYVKLANLYVENKAYDKHYGRDEKSNVFLMKKKFTEYSKRAIEELKILRDYAQDDPWVHVQLAYNYHDLQMPEEEIKEYEIIHRLCPEDQESLFKLGVLYFQTGYNGKGLKVYKQLKTSHFYKAEELIKLYGIGSFEDDSL